jgi:DeoR family fructose operon transcriptional repressor
MTKPQEAAMSLNAEQRRALIHEHLSETQLATVSDLSERFGVSEVSIRRDLERLEAAGLLKRVHGGAVAVPDPILGHSHAAKMRRNVEQKVRIGQAAASLIAKGDRLIFDSGTTPLQVARHIPGDLLDSGHLTVLTASLPIVYELGPWKSVHLILLGGIYLPEYEEVVGPQALANVRGLHADKVFLGADGLTFTHGVTTANLLEAELDRALIEAASQVIVVSDSSKIGLVGLTTVLPIEEIHTLITDEGAPADFVSDLREAGVEVILA